MVIETFELLNDVSSLKDIYLNKHHQGVYFYSSAIAKSMNLPDQLYEVVKQASLLHDIGKIGIPNDILFKPGKLTYSEWKIMKLHPVIGAELLFNGSKDIESQNFNEVVKAIRLHHERWDGTGYPDGLKGEDIPLAARIIAVADSFDAMTTNRPYRAAMSKKDAMNEISQGAGSQFDPKVAEVFTETVFVS